MKGWAYALAHKEATVELILRKYSAQKSRDALLFEAEQTTTLVGRDANRIGEQDPVRWRRIAATYRQLGRLTDDTLPAALMWDGNDGSLRCLKASSLSILHDIARFGRSWATRPFKNRRSNG